MFIMFIWPLSMKLGSDFQMITKVSHFVIGHHKFQLWASGRF